VQIALIGMLTMKTMRLPISVSPEEEEYLLDCARSVGISFKMKLQKQWLSATYLDLDSQSLKEIKSPRLARKELVH
jgi:hypothetical protein